MGDKCYKIYKHTTPSNKVYIGLTRLQVQKRWCNGKHYNRYFTKAIEKYGWNNIKHEIIENKLSYEEACQKERYYIKKYESQNRQKGYNIMNGGTLLDDEVRLLMSRQNKKKKKLLCIEKIGEYTFSLSIFESIIQCSKITGKSLSTIEKIMKQCKPKYSIDRYEILKTGDFDGLGFVCFNPNNMLRYSIYEYSDDLLNYFKNYWKHKDNIRYFKEYVKMSV